MVNNYQLAFLLLLFSAPALAQRPKPAASSLPPADTVYFDRDWIRTPTLEEVAYTRIAHRTAEGKTIGTVRDYYFPSWKKQGEGKLVSESPDVLNGLCTGWYESGKMSFRGTFVNGQRQADFQSWGESGNEVKCKDILQDALPFSTASIHCSNCVHSSRKVFEVDVPAGATGVLYKLDVRDEGQPPITWTTAIGIAGAMSNPATGTMALVSFAASKMDKQTTGAAPTKSTKCHWYITPDPEAVQQFMDTKGYITKPNSCYKEEQNTPTESKWMQIKPGTRKLFVCVNNDNYTTDATVSLSVTALIHGCN